MSIFPKSIARRAVFVISTVAGLLALISILRAGFAFWLYSYIAKWVTVRLGLDYYLAELLAVLLTSSVMFMLPGIGALVLSRKQRLVSLGVIACGAALACVLVYTVGRNVYFNRITGEPLRYYAETPDGLEFSFTPGFHPRYGIEFRPYTREMAGRELQQSRREAESLNKKPARQDRGGPETTKR